MLLFIETLCIMATHVWIAQGPEIGSCQMQDSLKIAWIDIFLEKKLWQ